MEFTIVDQNGQHIDSIKLNIGISSTSQLHYDVIASNGTILNSRVLPSNAPIDLMPGISSALVWAKQHYTNQNLKLIFLYS